MVVFIWATVSYRPYLQQETSALDPVAGEAAVALGNVAWKKTARDPSATPAIQRALGEALDEAAGITWCPVPAAEAALVAIATGLTTYDAAYVWLAGFLGADLVTLDRRVASAPFHV